MPLERVFDKFVRTGSSAVTGMDKRGIAVALAGQPAAAFSRASMSIFFIPSMARMAR
jgi:hypothetical protein